MPRTARPRTDDPQVVDVLADSTAVVPAAMDPGFAPPSGSMNPVATVAARPVPEAQLSPEQRRIRLLEDTLAKERGRKDVEPAAEQLAADAAAGALVIHFLETGLTALGKVWYRGEQRLFDAQAYADTCDRNGNSWLDLADDEQTQIARYGKVMFRRGPWPGKKLTDATEYEALKGAAAPTAAELEAAQQAEDRARLTAPRLKVV